MDIKKKIYIKGLHHCAGVELHDAENPKFAHHILSQNDIYTQKSNNRSNILLITRISAEFV